MYQILLIDDSRADGAMYQAILVGGDPPFWSGVEVLWLPEPPVDITFYSLVAAVILDYNLTKTTGLEEARRIRAAYPNLPLMLMTGALPPTMVDADFEMFVAVVEKDDLPAVWDGAREMMRRVVAGKV